MQPNAAAVVDQVEHQVVIWHVGIDVVDTVGRLQGAWVVPLGDPRIETLVKGRIVLATDAGRGVAADSGAARFLDPVATAKAAEDRQGELRAAFHAINAIRKTSLVAPTWPVLVAWDSPVAQADPPVEKALGAARWLANLAAGWAQMETQRQNRTYLPGGPDQRPLPVVAQ